MLFVVVGGCEVSRDLVFFLQTERGWDKFRPIYSE